MTVTRSKKIFYNVLTKGMYECVMVVSSLVLPRLILQFYGSEYNGIISSITNILSFISILRLGVAGATRVELYKTLADKDTEATSSIIKATKLYMRKIAYVCIILVLLLMIIYPFVIETNYNWLEIAVLVLIIGIGTFSEYYFGITYKTLLDADQSTYIYTRIEIVLVMLNMIVSSILILSGSSIHITKFVSSIIFALCPVCLNFYVPRKYKLNKDAKPDYTALSKKKDVMASSIANIIHQKSDILVLTFLTTPLVVSVYSMYAIIVNGLGMLVNVFTAGLEGFFGNILAKDERKSLQINFGIFELVISVFISVIFSCAMLLILPFVELYTKGIEDIDYILPVYAVLVLTCQAIYCLRIPYLTVVQAAGKYKETKKAAYCEAGINLGLSVILTLKLGIYGAVIGTIVANCIRTVAYAFYVYRKILDKPFIKFIYRVIWTFINTLIIVVVCKEVSIVISVSIVNWLDWIYAGAIYLVIALLYSCLASFFLYKSDFVLLLRKIKNIV